MPGATAETNDPRTTAEKDLPEHLGGHFGNINKDAATLAYLINRYAIKTLLDVGCGPGGMLDEGEALGLEVRGVDGDWHVVRHDRRIICHDYTLGPLSSEDWDLIWCTEFVEHVEAQYQENFLATFDGGRVLFLTAAPPGFPGWHHVNCQLPIYWVTLLATHGWALDEEATAWVRANGGHVFTQRQGLVFVKTARSSSQP